MNQATFTFRVDEQLKKEFTEVAKAGDFSGAQLLRAFMRDYVKTQKLTPDHDAWFREQVQLGVKAADAGEVLSVEEVEAEAAAWRAEARRKLADTAR